jgi:fructose-1,6-bisphosphatase I / sedoheptulose-1,7-bisphosphatase
MRSERVTLVEFLVEGRLRHRDTTSDLNALILNVALACKHIAKQVSYGALGDVLGSAAKTNVQGETQQKLDVLANDAFLRANEWGGHLAGMVSEEMEEPFAIPEHYPKGQYLLVFDPLDGSSNIDVNGAVGSIFSILRSKAEKSDAGPVDFLQPGSQQVCAGYAIYGPSTMLVLTLGAGVYAFTLDPLLGEFILTRSNISIPPAASEFAINASNSRFWEPAVKAYVADCLAGKSGPRGKDFNMRWVASLVAELHRILVRGGVFLYPRDTKDPSKPGRLRLLYEANPVAMLVEQSGGRASTGLECIVDIVPHALHQRVPLIFGAREEVVHIENLHREGGLHDSTAPLFGSRGLFRDTP